LLIGKTALLKKCKFTEKRIRNDGFEMFFLNKEFKINSRGESKKAGQKWQSKKNRK
jgi:hypothetical protein